jgi:lysozyme
MNLEIAASLCRQFEGFRSKPYLCPAGIATIGYGSTYYADKRKVTLEDPPMSQEEAHALLMIIDCEYNQNQPMLSYKLLY